MILITGSEGLVGRELIVRMKRSDREVRRFDLRRDPRQDTRDRAAVSAAVDGVEGIVHLAAVSRVVWAQTDPQRTQSVNVDALAGLLAAAGRQPRKPWVIFASSREVYGEPDALPVPETAPLRPLNVYARSKVAGEELMSRARAAGLRANVVRLSNVYGSDLDHQDRVVPAFARAAAEGGTVRIDGPDHMFDFTHVEDVARGIALLADRTAAGDALHPIHLVTGRGTTLSELAALASRYSGGRVACEQHAPRSYDVARFRGDPELAASVLGWRATIDIEQGFGRLADAFASQEQAAQTA